MSKFELLDAPGRLVSLDQVPEKYRGLYRVDDLDGTWVLCEAATAVITDFRAQSQLATESHKQEVASIERHLDEATKKVAATTINAKLQAALLAHGCAPGLVTAAVTLLRAEWKFTDTGKVVTNSGDVLLTHAVREWMASQDGQAFKARKPVAADEVFSAQLQAILRGS